MVGGETAEMPGTYEKNKFDLAGLAVGLVEQENLLTKNKIKFNDVVLAVPSSGLHSMVHVTISNEGQQNIALLRAETQNSSRLRFFRDGNEVENIIIPSEDIIAFDGNFYSMKITNLSDPLKKDALLPVIFHFSGDIEINVIVVIGETSELKNMEMGE